MCKYKKWQDVKRFYSEANNGGNYLLIEEAEQDGWVHVEIGHCCTISVSKLLPIELITAVFTELTDVELSAGIMNALWDTEYGKSLAKRIRDINNQNA
jgi:hypothetical protein